QWKRLPVRISDARCPPTIPTRQDSRFIGRAHTKLVHAKKGNRLLLTLRTLNLRRWDDRAVTPCRPRYPKSPLSEAFLLHSVRTSNNAASARSSRLDVRTAYLRDFVALLMLLLGIRAPIE